MNPRQKNEPLDTALAGLREAAKLRQSANERFRDALFAAVDAGGSIRTVAGMGGISTRTLQDWLKQRVS